ncbi:hypothetical protein MAPG_01052 [Magnaporthiopsis poae ATCC 64411]|uniref:Uncharacterized protein n=1 Tax=Magnaporthiopsis poae (strain ATCC 64411 / 73-15) TaxID=644358 RepID=A0A0C4DMP1_MAGP6|nr:hypothetical protein MAPG_01052 [Magnaporthiopsis poae ATCC 64411]
MAMPGPQVWQWMTAAMQSPEEMYTTGRPTARYGLSYNPDTNTIVHGADDESAKKAIHNIEMSMRVWIMAVSEKWPEFVGVQMGQITNPAQNVPITCALIEFEDNRPGISWMMDRIPRGNVTDLTRERIERQLRNCYRELAYDQDGVENQDMLKMIDETVELHVLSLAN